MQDLLAEEGLGKQPSPQSGDLGFDLSSAEGGDAPPSQVQATTPASIRAIPLKLKMNWEIGLDWKGGASGDRFILKPYPEEKRTFR